MPRMIRLLLLTLLASLPAGPVLAHGGVWIGGGYVYPPPHYRYRAPPPYYYAVPAVPYYYHPPAYGPAAQACYAGPYMCQLDHPVPLGAPCSCPAKGGERAWGRAG